MKRIILHLAIAIIGFIITDNMVNKAQLPIDWSLPYNTGEYSHAIHFSSGPHAWGNTNGLSIVNSADASGIDFSATDIDNCGLPDNQVDNINGACSFNVRSMADGYLIYAGVGQLGNQVAIRLITGEVVVYGHLHDINDTLKAAFDISHQAPVVRGSLIGRAGGTGISGGSLRTNMWPTHLHVDLRDGQVCTRLCMVFNGTQPLDDIGNPLSWDNRVINDFVIHGYHTSQGSSHIYNYDGVAINMNSGGGFENLTYENDFAYTDVNSAVSPPQYQSRLGVSVRIPQLYADQCNSLVNCENINLTNAVAFAGNGYMGGGGSLELVSQPGSSDPSNTVPSSNPTPVITPTDGPTYGDDPVDLREHINYGGTQYGNADPNTGIINIPSGLNDLFSSVQIDAGKSVMIYEHTDGQGGRRCLNQSVPDLSYTVFDNGLNANNAISSFDWFPNSDCNGQMPTGVSSGDTITVYAGFNWQGTQYGGSGTAIFNLPDYIEGAVSSIGVYPSKSALVFQLDNQQGGAQCFSAGDPDLRDNFYDNGQVIDDNMHSLQLFNDSSCGGWTPVQPTATSTSTATSTATASPTSTVTATATNVPLPNAVELLTAPWNMVRTSGGSVEKYQSINPNVLSGRTHLRVTLDLHGINALGGDASALIFDQNGWKYISLSNYVVNGFNGVQTVDIPISAFGLNLSQPVGTLHTRFWYSQGFTVDITSIIAYGNSVPATATPTSSVTATASATSTSSLPAITRAVLIRTDSNQDIGDLYEGYVIDTCVLGTSNFSIRAEGTANVSSVMFGLDGNANFHNENSAPYALNGDNTGPVYTPVNFTVGTHVVSMRPYTQDNGGGVQGTTVSYTLNVIGCAPTSTPTSTTVTSPDGVVSVSILGDRLVRISACVMNVSSNTYSLIDGGDGWYDNSTLIGPVCHDFDHQYVDYGTYQIDLIIPTSGDDVVRSTSVSLLPPTATPTQASVGSIELLDAPWYLSAQSGSAELYQTMNGDELFGRDSLSITLNTHGACLLTNNDDNSIILDQNGWNIIKLTNYIQNCYDGVQVITVPLSHFVNISGGANLNTSQPVGTLHVRIWLSTPFTVDITSIVAFDSP